MKKHLFFILLLLSSLGVVRAQEVVNFTIDKNVFKKFTSLKYTIEGDEPKIINSTKLTIENIPVGKTFTIEVNEFKAGVKYIIANVETFDTKFTEIALNKWQTTVIVEDDLEFATVLSLDCTCEDSKNGTVEIVNELGEIIKTGSLVKPNSKLFIKNPTPNLGCKYDGIKLGESKILDSSVTSFLSSESGYLIISPLFSEVKSTITFPTTALSTCDAWWVSGSIETPITWLNNNLEVKSNTDVTVKVLPKANYSISEVKLNNSVVALTDGKYTFKALDVNYSFDVATYAVATVAVRILPENTGLINVRTVSGSVVTNGSLVPAGEELIVTPVPNSGFEFVSITAGNSPVTNMGDGTYSIFAPASGTLTITANFKEVLGSISVPTDVLNTCNISWIVNGVEEPISTQNNIYNAAPGTVVKTKIVPIEGYKLGTLRLGGNTVTLDQENCYETVIVANQELNWLITVSQVVTHTVNYSSSGNGSVGLYTLAGELISSGSNVVAGTLLELKVVSDVNYNFSLEATKTLSNVNIVVSNNRYYITASNALNIVAQFDKLPAFVNDQDLSTIELSTVENLSLSGVWNTQDFTTLASKVNKQGLKSVVIAAGFATLQNTELNSVFANCISLKSADLRGVGNVKTSGLFTGCSALRYINISAGITLGSRSVCLTGTSANLLIYGEANSSNPWEKGIYVAGTQAGSIELVHGEPFECPLAFNASSISYTREFTKLSGAGKGYDAIVLPFSPQNFTTVEANERVLKPWASYDSNSDTEVPFWLCRVTPSNEDYSDATLTANIPYLISFPNDPLQYGDAFNVSGKVKFSAINAQVSATSNVQNRGQAFKLTSSYENIISGADFYAMYSDGSYFENTSLRTIVPFEAYASSLDGSSKSPKLYIGRAPTGIDEILKNKNNSGKFNIFVRGNDIIIDSEVESTISIYNVSGALVKTVRVEIGENIVSDMSKGIYIINGKKVVL